MHFTIDTHVHSIASGHAYSTVEEIARFASSKGILVFALTDHGPSIPGAPNSIYFGNLAVLPEEIYGVRVLKGIEANILDYEGNLDLPSGVLKKLEFVIASFHDLCIESGTVEQNTAALIGALKNPLVDVIAHPGNPRFQVDIDSVVKAAKHYGKLIEINNHSFRVRAGSRDNCIMFARKCMEYGVRIVCGSDAHISFDVGKFDKVYELLAEVGMPEELIINISVESIADYLESRKARLLDMK